MPVIHKTRVKETASNKPNASTAFNLSGSAATGFQTFAAAYSNGQQLPYHASNGTAWESGIATFTTGTPNTLVRSVIYESSNTGSAVDFSGGGDVELFVEWPASFGSQFGIVAEALIPGGRLTLESGVPVSTTDQTAKSTLYYTPFLTNEISLFNGSFWVPVEFTQLSITLSGLTSGRPYDVFCYLSGGAATLELLAWSSTTARATDITLQDGRYCKSGDKTRLYLGSFHALTATTTEDSAQNRLVFNLYNQVDKKLSLVTNDVGHTWTGTTGIRQYANNSSFFVSMMAGVTTNVAVFCGAYLKSSSISIMMMIGWNYDLTNSLSSDCQPMGTTTTTDVRMLAGGYSLRPAGYTKCNLLERSNDGAQTLTAAYGIMTGAFRC